jgi:hypothetical protein
MLLKSTFSNNFTQQIQRKKRNKPNLVGIFEKIHLREIETVDRNDFDIFNVSRQTKQENEKR